MAVKISDQISIVDVTDAYSVILTADAYTFAGTTTAAKAGSTTTQIIAMRGAEQVAASVVLSEIVKPDGVTVTKDSDTTSPTLTIAVTTSVTAGGVVKIPVHIGDIVINKEFTFAIAFTGQTGSAGKGIKSTEVKYQASSSGTVIPTGTWVADVPSVSAGQFLWTRTVITYTDNTTSTAYSVGRSGTNGTGVTISSKAITYVVSTNGTTAPTSGWQPTIPTVPAGSYLWTQTVVSYSDGTSTTAYSVARNGTNGANGADAITMTITSSNGTIFKNSSIETTLTAHVYKAGTELNSTQIAALGTVKWYKDGGTTAVATGTTLTIDAGSVTNKATYTAQLEG